ncbi:MAG: hypothetical protein U0Y10_09240 [Spirosomataceae bacterium]
MKKLTNYLFLPLALFAFEALSQSIPNALQQLEREQFTDATAQMAKIVQNTPTAESYFYSGYVAVRTKQLTDAKAFFEKGALLDEKRRPLNKAGLGIVAHLEGRTADADAIIAEVMKESKGKDAEILWRIGEAYTGYVNVMGELDKSLYKDRNAQKAIEYLEMALKRDKKNGGIWLSIGDARDLLDQRNAGPAVTAYEFATDLLTSPSVAKTRIGNVYWRGRSTNIASDYFKAAIQADSLYAPAYLQLAEMSFATNKTKIAAINLDKYIKLIEAPTTDLMFRSAKFDYLAKNYQSAIEKVERLNNQLADPMKYRIMGRSYFNLKNYDKTISNLTVFVEKAPEKVEGIEFKMLGRSYQNTPDTTITNKDSLTVYYLAKAAETDSTENLYSEIAKISYKLKHYEEAINYIETGNKKFKKSLISDTFWLGMAAYQSGRKDSTMYQKADSAFAVVEEANPNHISTILYRARANYYGHTNKDTAYVKSIPFYERFVELAQNQQKEKFYQYDMKIALKYLYVYYSEVEKDIDKAKTFVDTGARLYPKDPDFKQLIESGSATQ